MNEPQRHRIRRHLLEVGVFGEDEARPLQRELLRIHRRRLVSLIERCLTQASQPDRLYRIESLVVDLGTVDPENLERDVVERLGARLPRALAEHITADVGQAADSGVGQAASWAAHAAGSSLRDESRQDAGAPSVGQAVSQAAHAAESSLRDESRQDAGAPSVGQAMPASGVGQAVPASGVGQAMPASGVGQAVPADSSLRDERRQDASAPSVGQAASRAAQTADSSLRHERRQDADAPSIEQAASRAEQMTEPHSSAESRTPPQELAKRAPGKEQGGNIPSLPPRQDDTWTTSQLELLELFARTGNTPWWADASRTDLVDESLTLLSRDAPRPLAALIRRLIGRRPSSLASGPDLRRLVVHASDEALTALFGVLSSLQSPAEGFGVRALLAAGHSVTGITSGSWRTAVWEALLRTVCNEASQRRDTVAFRNEVLTQVASTLGLTYVTLAEKLRGGEADTFIRQLVESPEETEREHTDPPTRDEIEGALPATSHDPDAEKLVQRFREPLEERESVDKRAPRDLSYSDCDEVYVENSGLVLLWPFLGSFFERLELMTDKAFHDEAACQRAVGLLQYLVTEDPAPPEYQVTLGKLLCGMEAGEVFDFGPPVSEEEAEECTGLLRAVIGHAPILNDMSVAGFRGTFLIRKGVLSVRHGTWLLRVERQTWDVVLERFPWDWSWVKLPFMDAALSVEW